MHHEQPVLPPTPVVTRWNTWFQAVKYHQSYFGYLPSFVRDELLFFFDKLKKYALINNLIQLDKIISTKKST